MGWVKHAPNRNHDWQVPADDQGMLDQDVVQRIILLDIREELRQLNRVFSCHNFLAIPGLLREIAKQTKKAKRKRKVTA